MSSGDCEVCQKPYIDYSRGQRKKFCSYKCWNSARYKRLKSHYRARYIRRYALKRVEHLAANRVWQKAHPEYVKHHRANMRAKRRGAFGKINIAEWSIVEAENKGRCSYCGEKSKLVKDHVVPLARGGTNTIDNVVAACQPCNRTKHANSLVMFLVTRS